MGVTRVAPDDVEQGQPQSNAAGWSKWVYAHRVPLLVTGICLAIIAVVVPVAVCTTVGCPSKSSASQTNDFPPGSPRLIVNFNDPSISALSLIPALLAQYTSQLNLTSSLIQILDFISEDVLQEAKNYLASEPSLNFLTRDFNMTNYPNITNLGGLLSENLVDTVLQDILDKLDMTALAAGGRKLSQTSISVNDPFYLNKSQYYVDKINATGAWGYSIGASDVIVAVLDTGLDLQHPDLQRNLWVNTKEIPGNGIDDDGNGYIDDVYGYDFAGRCAGKDSISGACNQCGGRSDPWAASEIDPIGYYHGTHVAGLIGAVQNNGAGITGVAPGVKLMILKVSDCLNGGIQASSVFTAFDYALKMGAHIVSCSFGSPYSYGFYPLAPAPSYHLQWTAAYTVAMKPLSDKGVLAVVASGNDAIDLDNLAKWGYSYPPCLVNLPNVLCVGGTDGADGRAHFSNYGNTKVHIGSPAMQIYSTMYKNQSGTLSHTYGPLNGTSMATPIVSGAAALALSLLGTADGNYFKATQVRNVLMSTATRPTTTLLPWLSQSRLNSGLAMWQATVQMKKVLVPLTPLYSLTAKPAASVSFQGVIESFYATAGNQFSNDISGQLLDTSLRNITSPNVPFTLTSFKYNSGVVVTYSALLQLSLSGVWGIQVQTTSSSLTTWVFINGQEVTLNTTTQIGVFTNTASGWFRFELRIAFPAAGVSYNVKMKSPSDSAFLPYYAFSALGPANFQMPDYAQNIYLSNMWQVFYNKVDTATAPLSAATIAAATPKAKYTYSTVLQDPFSVILGPVLFPGDASATTATMAGVGFMQTFLKPAQWQTPVSFSVTCRGCQLQLDGITIVDVFEPLLTGVAIRKMSPCITLSNSAHQLVLRFALKPINQATMSVTYAACAASVMYGNMAGIIYNPLAWQPDKSVNMGNAAYIGGLQCDVYRNASGVQTTAFSAQGMRPAYKVRLPFCPSTSETINAACSSSWSFSLETILPGLGAGTPAGGTYGVRCWTHWNKGFTAGAISVAPASANPVAYLGGNQVFGPGAPATAPSTTLLAADTYQALAVDWFNVAPSTVLSVSQNGALLPIDLTSMRLAIGGLADQSGADLINGSIVVSGVYGAYTATAYALANDVPSLVLNDLTQPYISMGSSVGKACDSVFGLNKAYSYSRILGTQVRYTQGEGYYYTPSFNSGTFTIQVDDVNASSTMIVMGNVTVRNAPRFSSEASGSTSTFQVNCPGYVNIYTNVITKTKRSDAKTYFSIKTVGAGDWDSNQWARISSAPGFC